MISVDVVIFGGGIAGLWTLAQLTNAGYNAVLLETDALGSGQTIKSQGIIHGGLKYALTGSISSAVAALQDMPTVWQQCLDGNGDINLSAAKVLSPCQHLWSVDRLTGGITTLFASNSLKSQVAVTAKEQWPSVMQFSAIQTKLYELAELVLDIPSVLHALSAPYKDRCVKIDANNFSVETGSGENILHVNAQVNGIGVQFKAQKYIFTAGSGNQLLTKHLAAAPAMQVRPLQMVLVKAKNLLPLYGHCVGLNTTPRMTITTHMAHDNVPVWYLGGKIAEEGVQRTAAEQIDQTKSELRAIFPGLDISAAEYATFFIDRAEAKQSDGTKPTTTTMFSENNYITAWPTKLALAPILAQQILDQLNADNVTPQSSTWDGSLPQAQIATPIWDQLL
ncbi:MAG TPA: FAD-dependent oxidoreductase [Gammaproteobacteria bacterium]|nr:FAD-dependent oxidoreductase [Gammaproteobacteria bacterium]